MPHVVVAGPATWNTMVDVPAFPEPRPQTVFTTGHHDELGGTSAGKALTLARLSVDVTLRTALGDDDVAERITAALVHPRLTMAAARGVGPSERHLNLMTPDGARLSIYLDLPPDPGPVPDAVRDAIVRADVVVADLTDHAREVIPIARAAGVPLWCDVHDYDGAAEFHRQFVEAADVLAASDCRTTERSLPPGWTPELAGRSAPSAPAAPWRSGATRAGSRCLPCRSAGSWTPTERETPSSPVPCWVTWRVARWRSACASAPQRVHWLSSRPAWSQRSP